MTTTDVKTRLYERLEHLNDAEIKKVYELVDEEFPRTLNKNSDSNKRQLGTMKGQFELTDDWNSDKVNEEIAHTFYQSGIFPDTDVS